VQQLNQVLRQATESIEPLYFQLPIDGSDPIFRERVYCYELYHQLRRIWPADTPFSLNGEVVSRTLRREGMAVPPSAENLREATRLAAEIRSRIADGTSDSRLRFLIQRRVPHAKCCSTAVCAMHCCGNAH
jgi:hypothetical protein